MKSRSFFFTIPVPFHPQKGNLCLTKVRKIPYPIDNAYFTTFCQILQCRKVQFSPLFYTIFTSKYSQYAEQAYFCHHLLFSAIPPVPFICLSFFISDHIPFIPWRCTDFSSPKAREAICFPPIMVSLGHGMISLETELLIRKKPFRRKTLNKGQNEYARNLSEP